MANIVITLLYVAQWSCQLVTFGDGDSGLRVALGAAFDADWVPAGDVHGVTTQHDLRRWADLQHRTGAAGASHVASRANVRALVVHLYAVEPADVGGDYYLLSTV